MHDIPPPVAAVAELSVGQQLPRVDGGLGRREIVLPDTQASESEVPRVLMLAPREFQQRLKQAERAIAQRQFGEAIDQLASLLHAPAATAPSAPSARTARHHSRCSGGLLSG